MGNHKKIKSSKNLNKWRKGDSCISNPKNDKHRRLALENRASLVKFENKGLTIEAVQAHTEGIDITEENTLRADDVASEDFRSNHSIKTFGTNFTTCTIPAFEKFFEKYTQTSATHNRMLSIHSIVQEDIQASELPETSTSYLCGLMKCLAPVKNDEEDLNAALKLVSMVIKSANPAVLQECFGSYLGIFDNVIRSNEESRHVLVNLFGCLSVLLRAQQPQEWIGSPLIKHVIQKMLYYTISEIPKTRHSAQYNIVAIMKGSCFMPDYRSDQEEENVENVCTNFVQHPIAKFVGEFISRELSSSTSLKNAKTTLHLLVFLKLCISSLPTDVLEEICTKLLQIIHMGDTLVKKCSMEVILSLFQANVSALNAEQLSCLIRALSISGKSKGLMLVPNINDSTLCGIWMTTITRGVLKLIQLDPDLGFKMLTSWMEQVVYCWNSDHTPIHDDVVNNIELIMVECVIPLEGQILIRENEMRLILSAINKGLSLQCQNAWSCVFTALAMVIPAIGTHLPQLVTESIKRVSEFACEQHAFYWKSVERTIGETIKSIGVSEVMNILPIEITGNLSTDGKHLWILPVIKKYIRRESLCYYLKYFSFLAEKCHFIVEKLRQKGETRSLLFKKYETVELQLWGLFPAFAKRPVDQEQFLQDTEFCKKLCSLMRDRDDIRRDIMLGLRNLIENCSVEEPGQMAVFAKNYVPVLFNLFLTLPKALAAEGEPAIDNSHRLVAFNTAKMYFVITPPNIMNNFFEVVMKKLSIEKEGAFSKRPLICLLREFVPYLSAENIQKTYESTVKYLPKKDKKVKESVMQKGAFRIIEKIWQTKNDICSSFTNSKLWEIFEMLKVTSRRNALSSRLNIMHLVLDNLPITLKEAHKVKIIAYFLQSGVQHCKRDNFKRPRSAAYRLVFAIGPAMERLLKLPTAQALKLFLEFIPHAGDDSVIATKIDVLMVTLMKYKEFVDYDLMDEVMQEVLKDLTKPSAIISSACLSFLSQVYRFWSTSFMSDFVETTIVHLLQMDKRCREGKHRLMVRKVLCRLLRRFGSDRIKVAIPEDNVVMRKVVKNLMTLEARKAKERVRKEWTDDEQEYEEDEMPASGLAEILKELDIDDEEEGKNKMPKKILKKRLYIKEGGEDEIIDLLDPSSVFTKARKVRFAAEQQQKPAEPAFKIDQKTGKFIIEEENAKEKSNDLINLSIDDDALFGETRKRSLPLEGDSDEEEVNPTPSKVRKTAKNRKREPKRIGFEFKAKRAGGDIKKGGVLPYAYVKLDRKMLNRRFRSKSSGQFKGIVNKGIRQAPRKRSV